MPPLMVRGGVEQSETEGIRRSEAEQTIPQSVVADSSLYTRGPRGDSFLAYGSEDIGRRFPKKVGEAGRERAVYKSPRREGLFLCCRGTDFVDF